LDIEIAQINFKVFAEGRKIKLYLLGSAKTFPQKAKATAYLLFPGCWKLPSQGSISLSNEEN
jgi:hypothetical protein